MLLLLRLLSFLKKCKICGFVLKKANNVNEYILLHLENDFRRKDETGSGSYFIYYKI